MNARMCRAARNYQSSEKYLGDVNSSSRKIDENIQMRHDKGMGIINSIMSILKEISFGQFYFEIAMMLRTSMRVNGMLFSIEKINSKLYQLT